MRALHDVAARFPRGDDDTWAYAYPDRSRHEVICHNDFAPYNLVFQDGMPVGVIDFDLAGPGPRLRDWAYLAYWMTPLSFGSADLRPLTESQARAGWPGLRLLCSTYGTNDHAALLSLVSEVLHHMGSKSVVVAMVDQEAAQRLGDGQHLAHWRAEAAAFDAQLPGLRLALG